MIKFDKILLLISICFLSFLFFFLQGKNSKNETANVSDCENQSVNYVTGERILDTLKSKNLDLNRIEFKWQNNLPKRLQTRGRVILLLRNGNRQILNFQSQLSENPCLKLESLLLIPSLDSLKNHE